MSVSDDNSRYRFFNNTITGNHDELYDYAPAIGSTGDFKRVSGIDVAIYAIRTLLLTPLGHYPFDPTYGSLLYEKLFEPADEITREEIEYEVTERIREFEDRVKVTNVVTAYSGDRKTIRVDVYIDRDGVKGTVSLNFNGNNRMFGLEDDITIGLT